jgi:hypothetical protein
MAISGSKWNKIVKNQQVRPGKIFFEDYGHDVADHDHDSGIMVSISRITAMIPK